MIHKTVMMAVMAAVMLTCCGARTGAGGCGEATADDIGVGNGDLVFVCGGEGSMSQAICSATGQYDHVGIVRVDSDGSVTVIDATPQSGVTKRPWEAFTEENPRYVVARVEGCDREGAVTKALGYVGTPYDVAFAPGDAAIYCSELVQLCYRDCAGNQLFESSPMNFRNADGTLPQYWVDHFAALGIAVPEGVPGTNPTDMSRNINLKIR